MSGLTLLGLTAGVGRVLTHVIRNGNRDRQFSETTRIQDRIESQPIGSAVLLDRNGVILARPVRIRDERGRAVIVIDRPLGRPLAAAGVGRHFVVPVGVHGNLSNAVRAAFEGMRPYSQTSGIVRKLTGDPLLTAPEMSVITLTIDAGLSRRIYELLPSHVRGASAVVMSAKTGELYAVVDTPGADVARDVEPIKDERLWAFLAANLPASTMKVLTGAWLLMNRPDAALVGHDCDGDRCWMRHGRVAGLDDAIMRSCDVWFRKTAVRIDSESWLRFLLSAGVAPVGIAGLPDSRVTIDKHDSGPLRWTHAVGQQIWLTLPGIATAYASVTSSAGHLKPPSIVSKDGDERIVMAEGPQVVTPRVAHRIRSVLRATATQGTAKTVNQTFKFGTASGKTGTGEVEGATSDAVFVALAPWEEPEWIVVVSVRGGGAGSGAGRLAGQILNLLPFGGDANIRYGAPKR